MSGTKCRARIVYGYLPAAGKNRGGAWIRKVPRSSERRVRAFHLKLNSNARPLARKFNTDSPPTRHDQPRLGKRLSRTTERVRAYLKNEWPPSSSSLERRVSPCFFVPTSLDKRNWGPRNFYLVKCKKDFYSKTTTRVIRASQFRGPFMKFSK